MRRRRHARPVSDAIGAFTARLEPVSPLADLQRVWSDAVGPAVAAQAEPTAVRDGVVTVTCSSSVWANELDLLAPELVARINAALGAERVLRLRCQAAPARSWAKKG